MYIQRPVIRRPIYVDIGAMPDRQRLSDVRHHDRIRKGEHNTRRYRQDNTVRRGVRPALPEPCRRCRTAEQTPNAADLDNLVYVARGLQRRIGTRRRACTQTADEQCRRRTRSRRDFTRNVPADSGYDASVYVGVNCRINPINVERSTSFDDSVCLPGLDVCGRTV